MSDTKLIGRAHVRQLDQSDCGVACLLSVIHFHGGTFSLEELRRLSGTSRQGTTLLGLLQAAHQLGFDAEGLEAESVYNLNELSEPAILHVLIENQLQHFVVFYPDTSHRFSENSNTKIKIGDPARGLIELSPTELDKIWQSKALLKLAPTDRFERAALKNAKKRKWIVDLVREDLPLLIVSGVLGVVIAMLGISSAVFSQKLIDEILPARDTEKLLLSLVLVLLLLLARTGLSLLRGIFMVRQGVDFNNRIIGSFYGSLLRLPKSFFDTRKTGDLVARMNDTRRIQSVLAVLFGSVSIDILVVLVSLVFVFIYSIWVGILIASCLPVYALVWYRFNKSIVHAQKEVMGGYALAESNFIDTIHGVADIKLANRLSFFENVNTVVYGFFQAKLAALGRLQINFTAVSEVIGVIFMMAIFGLSSWLVIAGQLLIGELVALLGIAGGIIPSVNRLIISNIQVQEALVAFDRMFEFTGLPREDNDDGHLGEAAGMDELVMQNVSFRFPGRKSVLSGVSFQAKAGMLVALLGESGHGKSTVLQLLQKFYQPEDGDIRVNGMSLKDVDTAWWRSQVASVPQEPKIFNGSLIFNIALDDQMMQLSRAIEFCEQSGFGPFFRQFPQGYHTLVGEEGINLSGGQKQLVVLARALFRQPRVLLLDEATAAMDRKTEKFVLDLLKQQKKGRITLLVTHRMTVASQCDEIVILESGTVAAAGTPKQLMATTNFFSESFDLTR
ncbi:MAG: peptidase domain-containing ABC transporter [Cyclobacteriaceae bacterium]|jgi:ATP-binding cassette subfamily B protein|nr:peptidase domain-containing ABC transporter [Cyclobacteriaceae bacterium]